MCKLDVGGYSTNILISIVKPATEAVAINRESKRQITS